MMFIFGIATALVLGSIYRIATGLRLNLYLLIHDLAPENRDIIAVTEELKKSSWWKTISHRKWKEDLELTLMDYQGQPFNCQIKYHLWGRYYLTSLQSKSNARLDRTPIKHGKRYFLRNHMNLHIGDRKFEILLTATPSHHLLLDSQL